MFNKKVLFFTWGAILWGAAVGLCFEETSSQEASVMQQDPAVQQEGFFPQNTGNMQQEPSTDSATSGTVIPEDATGVSGAIQMAQGEVRDPFQAQFSEPQVNTPTTIGSGEALVQVVLQGIGFGAEDAYAILNGEIYYTGEDKQGIQLLAVRRREVDISANGSMQTLKLIEDADIKRATERSRRNKRSDSKRVAIASNEQIVT